MTRPHRLVIGVEQIGEARIEEGQAIISVMDRGQGIGPDELDHIFEKFYRAAT